MWAGNTRLDNVQGTSVTKQPEPSGVRYEVAKHVKRHPDVVGEENVKGTYESSSIYASNKCSGKGEVMHDEPIEERRSEAEQETINLNAEGVGNVKETNVSSSTDVVYKCSEQDAIGSLV